MQCFAGGALDWDLILADEACFSVHSSNAKCTKFTAIPGDEKLFPASAWRGRFRHGDMGCISLTVPSTVIVGVQRPQPHRSGDRVGSQWQGAHPAPQKLRSIAAFV